MILVLNCGSQSIKWKLFEDSLKPLKSGKVSVLNQRNYQKILEKELKKLTGYKILAIGHRVVHGGQNFRKPLKITSDNLKKIEKLNRLAPLHNPYNILGIKTCRNIFKNILQVAVFDTEFFCDLPEYAYTYALPENISKNFNFKRYGFHGISHEYVAKYASKTIKKPFNRLKIITCHLGGGSSITAIKNGKAIDTSMGFTPMEGLVMMTRSGSIDPAIVLELVKNFGLVRTNEILNKESGIKGICGQDDMLEVLAKTGNPERQRRTKLALDVFVYSIKKYIGAYFAVLGGCDILVFTGSIGSGNPKTRNDVCKGLDILKKTKIMAIETDEELAIAQKVLKNSSLRGT